MRRVLLGVVVAITVAVAGCGSSDSKDGTPSTTTTSSTAASASAKPTTTAPAAATTAAAAIPEFWLRVDREGYMTANVNATYTDEQLLAAFLEIEHMSRANGKAGGWFVQIDCGDSQLATGGARQGNGKFALDSLGAARTGLRVGGKEFEPLANRAPCPPNLPKPAAGAVTARQVVDAVIAAGLPAGNPRDNTGRACSDPGCVQLITTDDFSVYQFADEDKASKWAAIWPSGYRRGLLFLRFTKDGSHPTDPAVIPQYEAVLDSLVDG